MVTIYLCFFAGGAVLPFLSVIFGSLGGGSDVDIDVDTGIDIDTDIDIDTALGMSSDIDVATGSNVDLGTAVEVGTGTDTGVDIDGILSIGLLPTSLMSLSALAIAFGAVGSVMTLTGKGHIITFVVAVIAGYFASVVVQTIIKTLKKVQKRNYAINENELLLYDGKVIDTILPGQLGTVSFNTLKDVHVSYPARCVDASLRLATGKMVKAIEIKNGIFIVEPKNKYE